MDFTIVCLCHNQAAFVTNALSSVSKQEGVQIQLLIVDDGSTDGSKQLIQQWISQQSQCSQSPIQEIRFFNLPWQGNCKAFNETKPFWKGQYLIDLAADDQLLPNTLIKRKQFAQNWEQQKQAKVGLVYSNALYASKLGEKIGYAYPIEAKENIKSFWSAYTPEGLLIWETIQRFFIAPPTVMFSTKALEEVGGYTPFLHYEDFDVYMKLANAGYHFGFQNEILMQVHTEIESSHGSKKSKKKWEYFSTTLYVLSRQAQYIQQPKHAVWLWKRLIREIYYYIKIFI